MKLCSRCQRKLKDCARLTPSSHRTCWITVLYSVCNRNTFTVILHGYFHSTMAILKPSLGLDSFDKQVTQSLGPSSWPHLYATTIMRQVSKLVQPTIPSTLKVQTNTIFQITKITHIFGSIRQNLWNAGHKSLFISTRRTNITTCSLLALTAQEQLSCTWCWKSLMLLRHQH